MQIGGLQAAHSAFHICMLLQGAASDALGKKRLHSMPGVPVMYGLTTRYKIGH